MDITDKHTHTHTQRHSQTQTHCLLPTVHHFMHIAHCPLPTAQCSLPTAHSLTTAHCPLLTAHHCHCPLHTVHSPLPTAHCSLLPAHCSLLTAHCPLPTARALSPLAPPAALPSRLLPPPPPQPPPLYLPRGVERCGFRNAGFGALSVPLFNSKGSVFGVTPVLFWTPDASMGNRQIPCRLPRGGGRFAGHFFWLAFCVVRYDLRIWAPAQAQAQANCEIVKL